ncbi:MAG: 1-deoxy-D-xylulose-5-phosphate reductoisomerase, partial [Porphyromonas sp.]|nr:1-deoxy-D-xylulose-5-phosphate reductoisomerase [Porphyromonas sp.]
QNPNQFHAFAITAHRNHKLLVEQAREFKPRYVVIAEESLYTDVAEVLRGTETEVLCGDYALEEVASMPEVDVVITAMVGYSGLRPTIAAIEARKTIGLANKETLVVGGALIMPLVKRYGARIIPVDSEHSAIYQCLIGEENNPLEKIILTASGGPFRRLSKDELKHVSVEQALKHPNWSMGAKVTIDSASLMNKGFEMIEARWLFDCQPSDIEVLVHPQSIIHSMVQFRDGAVKAQLGMPDMRLP